MTISWQVVTLIIGLAAIGSALVGWYWHYRLRRAELDDLHRQNANIEAAVERFRDPGYVES